MMHPVEKYLGELQESQNNPELKVYALVDGLQYERHFGEELTFRNGVMPLFRQSEDVRIAFAGPWLLDTAYFAQTEWDNLFELEKSKPALSWIMSQLELIKLLDHLEQQLNISLPDGKIALFRFYDPRVLLKIPSLLDDKQKQQFMAHITEWIVCHEGCFHQLIAGKEIK